MNGSAWSTLENAMAGSIRGVVAAIVTPITGSAEPDHSKLVELALTLLSNGCDGLNLLGTTGEATSFTVEQRIGVMSAAAGHLPLARLLVGTGAAAVGDAVRLSKKAGELGFSGVLLLPPFYYKGVGDMGVVNYVGAVVEATRDSSIPIYLYNFPALSGVPYTVSLVSTLIARFGTRIAGLKDSSGDMAYARSIAALPSKPAVYPSSEACLMEARSGTFAGCISATVNLNARLCARAYHDGSAQALTQAVAIRGLFDGRPLIPGIKALMAVEHDDPQFAALVPPLSRLGTVEEADLRDRYIALTCQSSGSRVFMNRQTSGAIT
jgi:4-hydroxy-tetrahydrodipicolinate synthase